MVPESAATDPKATHEPPPASENEASKSTAMPPFWPADPVWMWLAVGWATSVTHR